VAWDPHATRTIDGKSMHSRSDFSPYDGWEVTGWPRWTISRGEVVAESGEVTANPGRGRLAPRGPHRSI
jgi:dihydropyrimidinase